MLLALGATCATASVAAQAPATETAELQARELYNAGVAKEQVGNAKDALLLYRRSVPLFRSVLKQTPSAKHAFNLAQALRKSNDPIAASYLLEAIEAGKYGSIPPARRKALEKTQLETKSEIARVSLENARNETVQFECTFQKAGSLSSGQQLVLDVNPGAHECRFRSSSLDRSQRFSLSRGDQRSVRVPATNALAGSSTEGPLSTEPTQPGNVTEGDDNVLMWALIVGGAIVVGGAVVAGVLLADPSDPTPAPITGIGYALF